MAENYTDLMVDIETMGTNPGEMILSISAVPFNILTGNTDIKVFNRFIDIGNEKKLKINLNTMIWWLKQDKEAIDKLLQNQTLPTFEVLKLFQMYMKSFVSRTDVGKDGKPIYRIWGNSARFDLGMLEFAYNEYGLEVPWNYLYERDVRTLVEFAPHIKKETVFEGVRHNAISDCLHQIKYCTKIYNLIKDGINT